MLLAVAGCSSPAPGPRLTSVSPARVSSFAPTAITLRGEGFDYAVSADLDRPQGSSFSLELKVRLLGAQTYELLQPARPSPTEVTAVVPAGLPVGKYTVELSTARGSARLSAALEVSSCMVDCELPTDGGCFSWPDLDQDGFGARGLGAPVCADDAGARVTRGGDCRDFDPLSNPNAFEICNTLDDDCDGAVDDGTCALDAGWKLRLAGADAGEDWETATHYGRGRVWLGGRQRVALRAGSGDFVEVSACANGLLSAWASPSGQAFFGGQTGLTVHDAGTTGCGSFQGLSGPLVGVQGFGVDGVVFGALRDGTLIEGRVGSLTERPGADGGATVNDVQGASPSALFAVGGVGGAPRVWRLATDGGAVVDEALPAGVPAQLLTGVWAVSDALAYAVGTQGALLERADGGWSALPPADAGLRGVRAFSRGRVYAITTDARVLRFSGTGWEELYRHPGPATFTDLTGSAEDDLWVVGRGGLVLHWLE